MGEEETTVPEQESSQQQESVPPAMSGGMTENTWAMLVHLSALVGVLMPFGNIVAPLVVWILKKDEMPLIDRHGKEVLNFQISITIYATIAGIVSSILIIAFIGMILLPLVAVAYYAIFVIFAIIAGLKANEGGWFDYPMKIELIK